MGSSSSERFMLAVENADAISSYLRTRDFLGDNETVKRISVAGEGNMNSVLRVETEQRSFILKQSMPFVRKYPSVPAPENRIAMEHRFYELVNQNEVINGYTPEVYFFDTEANLMCLEDYGPANDFTFIYRKEQELSESDISDIGKVISELHFQFRNENGTPRIDNRALRELNHQHIFTLPLSESNGFDLDAVTPGLQKATEKFRKDDRLKKCAVELGKIYLDGSGSRLLHGDYYPGSWLQTDSGFKMIDPEFCYTGRPEFELGVALAHMKMAQQPDSVSKELFLYYHFDTHFDGALFSQFAGMEVIRRTIGLAQLPLELDLKERLQLLDEAYEWVVKS